MKTLKTKEFVLSYLIFSLVSSLLTGCVAKAESNTPTESKLEIGTSYSLICNKPGKHSQPVALIKASFLSNGTNDLVSQWFTGDSFPRDDNGRILPSADGLLVRPFIPNGDTFNITIPGPKNVEYITFNVGEDCLINPKEQPYLENTLPFVPKETKLPTVPKLQS